ncbi:unnamed protein product [Zymoseptoria tritici ST99CH_1E4]|uniref:PHD-type domain-containing protein n=1 Tax=Zymoseptoria tritici ST99CH_1E4 TaxID=1276532 RepID=A0A2H1H8D3_ZYMTR|nr:unnamed protein product [Zymoseptoria tritici ST99CH_1E4]
MPNPKNAPPAHSKITDEQLADWRRGASTASTGPIPHGRQPNLEPRPTGPPPTSPTTAKHLRDVGYDNSTGGEELELDTFCICKKPLPQYLDENKIIRCNNRLCKINIFHLRCVNLPGLPTQHLAWMCPPCRNGFMGSTNDETGLFDPDEGMRAGMMSAGQWVQEERERVRRKKERKQREERAEVKERALPEVESSAAPGARGVVGGTIADMVRAAAEDERRLQWQKYLFETASHQAELRSRQRPEMIRDADRGLAAGGEGVQDEMTGEGGDTEMRTVALEAGEESALEKQKTQFTFVEEHPEEWNDRQSPEADVGKLGGPEEGHEAGQVSRREADHCEKGEKIDTPGAEHDMQAPRQDELSALVHESGARRDSELKERTENIVEEVDHNMGAEETGMITAEHEGAKENIERPATDENPMAARISKVADVMPTADAVVREEVNDQAEGATLDDMITEAVAQLEADRASKATAAAEAEEKIEPEAKDRATTEGEAERNSELEAEDGNEIDVDEEVDVHGEDEAAQGVVDDAASSSDDDTIVVKHVQREGDRPAR